jgi:hypothetical protein
LEQINKFTDTDRIQNGSKADCFTQSPVQQDKQKTGQYNNVSVAASCYIGDTSAEGLPWGKTDIGLNDKIGTKGCEK